jgi:hypothetical protein
MGGGQEKLLMNAVGQKGAGPFLFLDNVVSGPLTNALPKLALEGKSK